MFVFVTVYVLCLFVRFLLCLFSCIEYCDVWLRAQQTSIAPSMRPWQTLIHSPNTLESIYYFDNLYTYLHVPHFSLLSCENWPLFTTTIHVNSSPLRLSLLIYQILLSCICIRAVSSLKHKERALKEFPSLSLQF